MQQHLTAPADVDELDHGGGGEKARPQAHQVAHAGAAQARPRWQEEVIGDQGEGPSRHQRRAATQAPGDGANQQDKNQQEGLDPRDPQDPGHQAKSGRHDAYGADGRQIGESSSNHASSQYGIVPLSTSLTISGGLQ